MITHTLKQYLDKQDFPVVIRALRQNETIWQTLQQGSLLEQLLNRPNDTGLLRWTPASIALTELGMTHLIASSDEEIKPLDDDILNTAAEALESLLSKRQNPTHLEDLRQAGMAALAIRERWMMLNEMEDSFFNFIHQCTPIWELTISILLGLVPNKTTFVEYFSHSSKESDNQFAIHALLSQPIQIENIAQVLTPILADQPVLKRSASLRMVNQKSQALAQQIATQLLETIDTKWNTPVDPFEQLMAYIERTELLKLSGQYHQVIPELEHIWKTTTRMQADMTAQLAQAAARGNDQTTALLAIDKVSELEKMFQSDEEYRAGASPIEASERHLVGRNSQLSDQDFPVNPANLLASVKLAQQNSETQKAQQIAHQVYDLTLKLMDKKQPYFILSSTLITPEFLYTFLETLLELELVIEAANIGKIAQQILPNDSDIVWLFAKALAQIGNLDDAIEHTDIALALAPDNHNIHRYLISLLIKGEHWHEARKESEDLLGQAKTIHPEDFTTLAKCYLQTGQVEDAVLTCEKGLADHPDAWQIHHLLGQIYQENKNYDSAQKHYSKAILEKPQKVEPWISLAGLHQESNEPQKALEKLQSAAEVIPSNPEIYLNIGNLQMAAGREIKALAAYSQAARFITSETPNPTRHEIGLQLGQTLLDSGYINEAITAFEKVHKENPTDEIIAYGYGQALMHAKRYEEAFKAISITIQAANSNSAAYLDFAELILILEKNPDRAIEFIQRVLVEEPDNERAMILLARATAAADDHQAAIQLYQEAFQTNLALEPEYFTLLSVGIADSAFATDHPEVAITFLQEALCKLPENLKLKQKLCQAFNQANLKPDALATLIDIRNTAEPSLDNLLWIADQAIALNDLEIAIDILAEANQIAPQMADVIIRLGYVLLENNQEEQARDTFSQLFAAENVDIVDMKMAAHALIGLGDISSSIPFIEKALEICDYQSNDLLSELTKLHLTEENLTAALDTLNKHLELEPTNSSLWQKKAQILLELGRQKASLDALKQAIQISPDNGSLHAKAAIISRDMQNLAAALKHIQRALDIAPEDIQIRFLCAHIHHKCLFSEQALEILSEATEEPNTLQWLTLKAEILVSLDPHSSLLSLARISAAILEKEVNSAAGLALQSITDAIEGKPIQALDLLEMAIANVPENVENQFDNSVLIEYAAMASGRWDIALQYAQQAAKKAPEQPLGYLTLAKIYTLQAEHQLNSQATQTINHAPGKAALQEEAKTAFQEAIGRARKHIPETGNHAAIKKWEDRGQYALFSKSPVETYTVQSPDDLAAVIAAWRRAGEKLTFTPESDEFIDANEVKFQLSLYYAKTQLENAESIAEEAAQTEPANPLYLANHAYIANRIGNHHQAYESIQKALSIWPDEPRWNAFAASIESAEGNLPGAITHLEQACALEADHASHFAQLGQAYLQNGLPGNALRVLQEAVSLSPLDVDTWITLSQTYLVVSDLENARSSVEKAISLAPHRVDALLLGADICFNQGDQKTSSKYIADAQKMEITSDTDLIQLTNLLVRQNKADSALNLLDKLIDRAFSPVRLLLQKAEILGQTKGVKEKLQLQVTLARDNPKNPQVLASLALTYQEVKMAEEAIRAAQYALKNAEDGLTAAEQSAMHFLLGSLYQRNGQLDQSLDHLTKSIQFQPAFVDASLEIGETLRQRREYTKALEYFENATELAPQDPRGYLKAGLLLKDGKDYPGAEAFLRKAASLDPQDIAIQRQLATVVALAIIHRTERV